MKMLWYGLFAGLDAHVMSLLFYGSPGMKEIIGGRT